MKTARMAAHRQGDSVKPPRNPLAQMVPGFSSGGVVGTAFDAIKNRKNVLDAAIDGATNPPPSAPAEPPAKPSMGSEADNYAAQAAQIEAEQQASAKAKAAPKPKSFLNKLGFSGGGKIEGKGTPTSDSIDATVSDTGDDIKVSTDERIVSAAQDAFLEKLALDLGFPSLDAMLEAGTGRPVGPTVKDGKPAAAFGATDAELKNVLNASIGEQPRPAAPPMNPSMERTVTGVNRSGSSFSQDLSAAQPVTAMPVAATAPPVVRDSFGNDMTQTNAMKKTLGEASVESKPSNPLAQRDFSMPEGFPVTTTPRIEQPVTAPQAKPVFQAGDASMRAADPKGYATVAGQQPGAQERLFANNQPLPASTPTTSAAPTPAQTATAPVSATPSAVGNGRGIVNPLNATAQKQNSFSEVGNASATINGPVDSHGNSMAATNEMKSKLAELTSTAPANAVLLGNSGLTETQALMDKWGREDGTAAATQAAIANPKSASAIASLAGSSQQAEATRNGQGISQQTAQAANETQRRGQTLNALADSERTGVTARGQDIAAKTQAAQLAGNPLDNALKQTNIDLSKSALSKAQQQDKMVAEMGAEQDPVKRRSMMDSLLAAQGKNPAEHRYIKVEGGEEMGPDGMTKIKKQSGVYDTITQKFIPMDGSGAVAPATVPQGAIDMLKNNPALAADFDKKFGAGAAKKILGK